MAQINVKRNVRDLCRYWCITNMGDVLCKTSDEDRARELMSKWPLGCYIYDEKEQKELEIE